jgi:hypothetical protein
LGVVSCLRHEIWSETPKPAEPRNLPQPEKPPRLCRVSQYDRTPYVAKCLAESAPLGKDVPLIRRLGNFGPEQRKKRPRWDIRAGRRTTRSMVTVAVVSRITSSHVRNGRPALCPCRAVRTSISLVVVARTRTRGVRRTPCQSAPHVAHHLVRLPVAAEPSLPIIMGQQGFDSTPAVNSAASDSGF